MNQLRIRMLLGVVLTLLMLIPVISGNRPLLLERFELDLYDLRLTYSLASDTDPRIVIVDVDERTMAAEGRWPWSRDKIAHLVDQLFNRYNVAIAGFDMVFSEPDTDLSLYTLRQVAEGKADLAVSDLLSLSSYLYPDRRLARALEGRPVVLGYPFDQSGTNPALGSPGAAVLTPDSQLASIPFLTARSMVGNLPMLQEKVQWSGFFDNPTVDSDGVYRRVPLIQRYQEQYYPSLALAMVMALFGEAEVQVRLEEDMTGSHNAITAVEVAGIPVPVDEHAAVLVPYRGLRGSFPYVPATDVLRGAADPQVLEGAIILVGTTAAGLLDLRVTPMSNRYPGVEVHANIISGILDERVRHQPDYTVAVELLQLLISGLLMSLLIPLLSVTRGTLVTLLWLGVVVGFNLYAWQHWLWVVPLGYTLALLILLYLLQQTAGFFYETRNRMQLATLFGQYIPPEIVSELNSEGAQAQMEGESRDMTVFFSDVRDFTSLSEALSPQQLTRMMNIYLSAMTGVIHHHRGTVDKYIGDAVMAFWGAPLEDPEHPCHALAAALDMQAALEQVNVTLSGQGLPTLAVGMGIHSGEMNVGNMGSSFRMAYTVMGDAVNLASRLEGLTKFYGVPVIVSDELAQRVPEYLFLELDTVRVKGRSEPVTLCQPLGEHTVLSPQRQAQAELFGELRRAYCNADWVTAQQALEQLEVTHISPVLITLYRERIEQNRDIPKEHWDPVFNHHSK